MNSARFIDHRGARILVLDYTRSDAAELAVRIEGAEALIREHPRRSLAVLTRVAGAEFSPRANDLLLAHIANNRPYVYASAVTGLGHLSKVVPVANRMTGRMLEAFDDEGLALDWLAAQPVPGPSGLAQTEEDTVRFVEHRGERILEIDFRNCEGEELQRRIDFAARLIRSEPEKSVLTMTLVHGMRYERATTAAIKEYVRLNKPYILASTVVGLDWLTQIVLPLNRLTGRNIKAFDHVVDAMDWLVAEAAAARK